MKINCGVELLINKLTSWRTCGDGYNPFIGNYRCLIDNDNEKLARRISQYNSDEVGICASDEKTVLYWIIVKAAFVIDILAISLCRWNLSNKDWHIHLQALLIYKMAQISCTHSNSNVYKPSLDLFKINVIFIYFILRQKINICRKSSKININNMYSLKNK